MEMIPSLVYEYSYIAPDGIDHHLFAELCSNKILRHNPEPPKYHDAHDADCKECLSKYISTIIYRSTYGINVAIGALVLIERFQEALEARRVNFAKEVEDAGRLFFVAYMISTKVLFDGQPRMRFWTELADYQYSWRDIDQLERQFYDIVGWSVHIDGPTFNRCLVGMMDVYHCYLERHELPSAPPPVYQKVPKHEITRVPVADVFQVGTWQWQSDHASSEGKASFMPSSKVQEWSKVGWQFLESIFPPQQVTFV